MHFGEHCFETRRDRNASVWLTSTLAVVAVLGTVALSVGTVSTMQKLWATSAVVSAKPIMAILPVGERSKLQLPSTAGARPGVAVGPTIVQVGAGQQTSVPAYVKGALALALGLCAAAWAKARGIQDRSVLQRLDLEQGMSMAAVAGDPQTTYHFLVANAKFILFDEEHAMELLREKRRFLKEKGLPQDFWVVPNPEFLDQLPDIDKRVLKPCCALVSTDEKWILFMKLRYDKVLVGSFKGSSDITKALASKGGDPLAGLPQWDVEKEWNPSIPYPKYAVDWFHPFLVTPPSA